MTDAHNIYPQVPKAFNGGSEAFLSVLWTSAVCNYESLAPQLHCSRPPPHFARELAAALPGNIHSIPDLIATFLQGSGAPCPALFESLKEGFSSLIDFDKVDDPSFRPRIFLWAATGCPTIDPTSSDLITVSLIMFTATISHYMPRLVSLLMTIPFMPMTGVVMLCLLRVRYVSEPVLRLFAFLHPILLNWLRHLIHPLHLINPRTL